MSEFSNHSDEDLLNQLKSGCEISFKEIFNRHWLPLYRIAYSRLKSKNDAEEIVQEIFVNLWQGRQTHTIINLSHYLKVAVKHRVISRIRSQIVKEKYWDYYKKFIPNFDLATEELVELSDLDHALNKAIQKLPEKTQLFFRLNRIQGLSIEEISDRLKVPRRTIEHHLTKSTRSLKVMLKDYILFSGWFTLFF